TRLPADTMGSQGLRRPVPLEIDPADEPIAEEERGDIVTVHALSRRGVDLDPIVEVEEPFDARAEEDQGVEGRQQRPGPHLTRRPRPMPPQSRDPIDLDLSQLTG